MLPEHYDSIDTLNMLQWERIHKKFDMIHLLVKAKKINKKQRTALKEVWEKIYSEYINTFGFCESFEDIIAQKLIISRLKNKQVITGDDSIENFIRAGELKLLKMQQRNVSGGNDIYKTKGIIEKYYGIRIPLAECVVREFYSYLKEMKKNAKSR